MNQNPQKQIIQAHGPDVIIKSLASYISDARKKRIEAALDHRLMSIQLALECPADLHNAFATMRSCEVFGISKIHIITPEVSIPTGKTVSKGAIEWLEVAYYENFGDFFEEMKKQNIQLAGAIPKGKESLDSLPIQEPLCLLLGNENRGLSSEASQACRWDYQIPMFGMTASLNLSVAAAISLYETTRRKRTLLQKPGDLDNNSRKILQSQYYLNSVDPRLIHGLF